MEAAVKLDFMVLKRAIAAQWEKMQKHPMFRVEVDKDLMWTTYLGAFPPGTNPKFRERTEHDCSCCKQFIRAVGDSVAIINGKKVSVWDVVIKEEPAYTTVAKAMSTLIHSCPIKDYFLHYDPTAGTDRNFEKLVEGQKTWNHFFVNIGRQFVEKKDRIPTRLSHERANHDVLDRSLREITDDAVDTVLELIGNGSLYRGEEQKFALGEFSQLKREYEKLSGEAKDLFAWTNTDGARSVIRIRNTALGTLLTDLSGKVENGVQQPPLDLEDAVKKWEAVMAPSNYKRPTALVTKAQIENAKKTLTELGLVSALERRYANVQDIKVNNVLFRDRSVKEAMGDDVFDQLDTKTSSKAKTLDKIEEVPVAKFLSDILPRAESVEVFVENNHANKLVSLITAVDPTSSQLFKWGNKFSWSYAGNFADSIKERVKKAGGSVVGDLCCRLAWDYQDDLDLHMKEPGGYEIYFSNRRVKSVNGGMLDVDANGIDGKRDDPAENIFYASKSTMREGKYQLFLHNYNRCSDGRGFEVEIEMEGVTHHIVYDKVVPDSKTVQIATIQYSKKDGFSILESLPSSQSVKTFWGVKSQEFHKVSAIMFSPNHWDDEFGIGNKHLFFMLEGCKNDGTARGFYNEFLKTELEPHRRVLEMVGGKMKVAESPDQLSGLGFGMSAARKETLVARVKGSFSRTIKIAF